MNGAKIIIKNDRGEEAGAHAPVIVSASRATDIPAFFSEWFTDRIKKGYVRWQNPFNKVCSYVSFMNVRVIVFWTKNPKPLIPSLYELDDRGIHYYFQFTLNDYGKEGLEPCIPPLKERIETFRRLSDLIGKEKVIWRFDPLCLLPGITPQDLLEKIENVGSQLKGFTEKLVFSFVDIKAYRKVRRNLEKDYPADRIEDAEFKREQMMEISGGLAKIREQWKSEGWDIDLATCAETAGLEAYGITHNRCVDDRLMKRIFHSDKVLMYYLSCGNMKDKGQRKACGCVMSKDIGAYNTCRHFCRYCYANTSPGNVMENYKRYVSDKNRDILTGNASP
jgi:DNA repair photolyase